MMKCEALSYPHYKAYNDYENHKFINDQYLVTISNLYS